MGAEEEVFANPRYLMFDMLIINSYKSIEDKE